MPETAANTVRMLLSNDHNLWPKSEARQCWCQIVAALTG